MTNSGDNLHYAVYNEILNDGDGAHQGMRSILGGIGNGTMTGVQVS